MMRNFLSLLILLAGMGTVAASDIIINTYSYDKHGWRIKVTTDANDDPYSWFDDKGYSIRKMKKLKLRQNNKAYFEVSCLNGVTNVTYTPVGYLKKHINSKPVRYGFDDGPLRRLPWNVKNGSVSLQGDKGIQLLKEIYQFKIEKLTFSVDGLNALDVSFNLVNIDYHLVRISKICGWELPKRWESSYHGFVIQSENFKISSEYPYVEGFVFGIRCFNNIIDVSYGSINKFFQLKEENGHLIVIHTIDDEDSVWEIWKYLDHGINVIQQGNRAMEFLQKLSNAEKLILESWGYDYETPPSEFNMTDSRRHIEQIAEQCNWKLN